MIVLREIISWHWFSLKKGHWLSLKKVFSVLILTLEIFGTLHCGVEWRTKAKEAMRLVLVIFGQPRIVRPCAGGLSADQPEKTKHIVFNLFLGY